MTNTAFAPSKDCSTACHDPILPPQEGQTECASNLKDSIELRMRDRVRPIVLKNMGPLELKLFRIQLWGCFDITFDNGGSCLPLGDKSKAIIATLCTAPSYKRSRKWLQAIFWSDHPAEKSASNLRQVIWRLKQSDIYHRGVLCFDKYSVWLDSNLIEILPKPHKESDFLEGLDEGGEAFEDWLRQERSSTSSEIASPPAMAPVRPGLAAPSSPPCIAAFPVIEGQGVDPTIGDSMTIGDSIMDVIVATLFQQGCVDVVDLRTGLDTKIHVDTALPPIGIVLRILKRNEDSCLTISLKRLANDHVIWTGFYDEFEGKGWEESLTKFRALASEVANAVHDHVGLYTTAQDNSSLFGAVHNVLSHSRTGQSAARALLTERVEDSGIARAWLMYTFAVAHAEQHDGLGPEALEELKEHCVRASAAEPTNPIVQAIVGHIYAFVFRQFQRAEMHHSIARKIGWNHPLVWTLSAMHANYASDAERAYSFSRQAISQSAQNPYRFFFEGPHSISCSLTNRHTEAIETSNRILEQKPLFLAVMRHMAASQAISGDLNGARMTIQKIRTKDPRFVAGELAATDYPLPSPKSVDLIEHAIALAGSNTTII